jgi:TPR repeat protein
VIENSNALFQNANSGNAESQFEIGMHFFYHEDFEKALPWFIKAADQGHKRAKRYTGKCYRKLENFY